MTELLPTTADPRATSVHLGIAEHGKLLALEGRHTEALACYREAIHLAVSKGDPEVFFRHYTICVLESLERMGAYTDVIEFCDRAIDHYAANPPPHAIAILDLATIQLRKAVVLIKAGDTSAAITALTESATTAARAGGALPLGATLSDWLARGFTVDAARLNQEQERHGYYSVRRDSVRPEIAMTPTNPTGPNGASLALH